MRSLFISYDGMTDPLGRSQVIPYVAGLAGLGHEMTILSAEKPGTETHPIASLLASRKISWEHIPYHKKPPILSSVFDLSRLARKAEALHEKNPFDVIHCRSVLPGMVGLKMKRKHGIPFIFDSRGFWADERVEGGVWNRKNPIYDGIYRYFKKIEKELLHEAAHTITLTHLGRDEILSWKLQREPKIQVIPCCADLELFSRNSLDPSRVENLRSKVGLRQDDWVLVYLGSTGTWYLLTEMLSFFKRLLLRNPNARFLFITGDAKTRIWGEARKIGIDPSRLLIYRADREEVPYYLSLAKLGISFIKPAYSKKASSPTKLGEMLGMGLPVVMNANVGDSDWIASHYTIGPLVSDLSDRGYDAALQQLGDTFRIPPEKIRDAAKDYFSLKRGVALYHEVYVSL